MYNLQCEKCVFCQVVNDYESALIKRNYWRCTKRELFMYQTTINITPMDRYIISDNCTQRIEDDIAHPPYIKRLLFNLPMRY